MIDLVAFKLRVTFFLDFLEHGLSPSFIVDLFLFIDYLNPGHSSVFGGICGKGIEDSCAYINSHINNLYIAKYGSNKDCGVLTDSGSTQGAL